MPIRLVNIDDYEELMRLYNDFVGEDRYSRHDGDSFQKFVSNPSCALFVAGQQSKLIGFAAVSVRSVVRYPKPIAELEEIFVDPESRQHGTGHALLTVAETFAREHGCHRLYMSSAYQHEAAHKFYESNGYKNNGYHFYKNL